MASKMRGNNRCKSSTGACSSASLTPAQFRFTASEENIWHVLNPNRVEGKGHFISEMQMAEMALCHLYWQGFSSFHLALGCLKVRLIYSTGIRDARCRQRFPCWNPYFFCSETVISCRTTIQGSCGALRPQCGCQGEIWFDPCTFSLLIHFGCQANTIGRLGVANRGFTLPLDIWCPSSTWQSESSNL